MNTPSPCFIILLHLANRCTLILHYWSAARMLIFFCPHVLVSSLIPPCLHHVMILHDFHGYCTILSNSLHHIFPSTFGNQMYQQVSLSSYTKLVLTCYPGSSTFIPFDAHLAVRSGWIWMHHIASKRPHILVHILKLFVVAAHCCITRRKNLIIVEVL